jgi:hypothetical protein
MLLKDLTCEEEDRGFWHSNISLEYRIPSNFIANETRRLNAVFKSAFQ